MCWRPGFRVASSCRGMEEPVIGYSWRCRRTHLSAISISHVFKDGAPVCQCWRVIVFPMIVLTPVSSVLELVTLLPACSRSPPVFAPGWGSLCAPESWTSASPVVQEDCCIDILINTLFWTLLPLCFACCRVQEKTQT